MPRRTPEEVEAQIVPEIVKAIYPVLIPMAQQGMAIQAKNRAKVTEAALAAWRNFTAR